MPRKLHAGNMMQFKTRSIIYSSGVSWASQHDTERLFLSVHQKVNSREVGFETRSNEIAEACTNAETSPPESRGSCIWKLMLQQHAMSADC